MSRLLTKTLSWKMSINLSWLSLVSLLLFVYHSYWELYSAIQMDEIVVQGDIFRKQCHLFAHLLSSMLLDMNGLFLMPDKLSHDLLYQHLMPFCKSNECLNLNREDIFFVFRCLECICLNLCSKSYFSKWNELSWLSEMFLFISWEMSSPKFEQRGF